MSGIERRQSQQGKNALSVLMRASQEQESSAKKRKRTSSQFVLCPAGCGKTIGEAFINVHLDHCLQLQESKAAPTNVLNTVDKRSGSDDKATSPACRNVTQEISPESSCPTLPEDTRDGTHNTQHQQHRSPEIRAESKFEKPDNEDLCASECEAMVASNEASASRSVQGAANAFSRMLGNSKKVFSSESSRPIQQCFYLDEENSVSVLDLNQLSLTKGSTPTAWTGVVVLRNRISSAEGGKASGRPARPVELTLATSYCNSESDATVRLVKNHSRLSVPVLKSILQKSIRRRRPLPAVRVAMELADKSVGDLLRRLPIIILEDSTLHPDFPFLVWLMVAHSKDFCLSRMWLTRVMKIVFEVASCPWSDNPGILAHAATSHSCAESDDCSCLYQGLSSDMTSMKPRSIVWSMLVRADYGGMMCDVQMLVRFAQVWSARFRSKSVSSSSASRLGSDVHAVPPLWQDIPSRIHCRAKQLSSERVAALVTDGIDRLMLEDICVEGIDFHCSSILDHLLSLPLVGLCTDILILDPNEEVPSEPAARRSWMEGLLKHCLWHFSSGVNRRQPLIVTEHHPGPGGRNAPVAYEELWKQLISKDAWNYQTQFVRERLAQSSK